MFIIKAAIAVLTLAFAGWLYFAPSDSGFVGHDDFASVQCAPLSGTSAAGGSLIAYSGTADFDAASAFVDAELENSGAQSEATLATLRDRLTAACAEARDGRLGALALTFGAGLVLIALPIPRRRPSAAAPASTTP